MAAPLFNRLPTDYQESYNSFFELTDPANIRNSMNLDLIVSLAEKAEYVLAEANPIWDTGDNRWGDRLQWQDAYQWHLDRLSHVKERLAQAIVHKKEYYENTWMGRITRFFLKLFCLWNNGNTAPIRRAEDFLLRYDSRYPVMKFEGEHKSVFFWPLKSHEWVQQNLNVQNFYNYDVPHAIEVKGGQNEVMPRFMVAVN